MSEPLPIPAVLAVDVEPFTDDQLDAKLDGIEVGAVVDTYGPNTFTVDDDGTAEWCARKFAALETERERVHEQAVYYRERIMEWEETETKRVRARADFFEGHLSGYMARRREESRYLKRDGTVDFRVKSVSLPSAVLKSSGRPARVKLAESDDAEKQAVEWCLENGCLAAVKRSLLVSGLKGVVSVADGRAVSEGGEVVPGLVVEPASVTYKVTLT